MERSCRIGIIVSLGLGLATILYGIHTCIDNNNQIKDLDYKMEAGDMADDVRRLKETRLDNQRNRELKENLDRMQEESSRIRTNMEADIAQEMTNLNIRVYPRARKYR